MDETSKPQGHSPADRYQVLSQDQFVSEHKKRIDGFRETFKVMSKGFKQCNMSIFDTSYRTITLTDGNAKRCGFDHAKQVEDVSMYDYRCDAAQDADLWERNNNKMYSCAQALNKEDFHLHSYETMGVYHYPNEIGFQIFRNYNRLLVHKESSSILGHVYQAILFPLKHEEKRRNLLMEYLTHFNLNGTLTLRTPKPSKERSKTELTDYEKEICFFTLMGWKTKQISEFMLKNQSPLHDRGATSSAVSTARARIGDKLGLEVSTPKALRDFLVAKEMHRTLPISLFADPDYSVLRLGTKPGPKYWLGR